MKWWNLLKALSANDMMDITQVTAVVQPETLDVITTKPQNSLFSYHNLIFLQSYRERHNHTKRVKG